MWLNPLASANSRRPSRFRELAEIRCSPTSSGRGLPAAVAERERSSRHEVAFNTAWLDRFPDQALRVAAGIPRKHASGGLGRVATTARGAEPSRQCIEPGSLNPG